MSAPLVAYAPVIVNGEPVDVDGVNDTLHDDADEFIEDKVQLEELKLPVPPDQLIVPFGIDFVPVLESCTVAVSVIGIPTVVDDGFGVIVVLVDLVPTVSNEVPKLVL